MNQSEYLEILNTALSHGGEYAEIFFEESESNLISYDNGKIEDSTFNSRKGVSIRVTEGEETVFAHTNSPDFITLKKLAENLSKSAQKRNFKGKTEVKELKENPDLDNNTVKKDFDSVSTEEKIDKINMGVDYTKSLDKRVSQITVKYMDSFRKVKIVNSDGEISNDIRRYPVFYVMSFITDENGQIYTGISGNGANMGYEFFDDDMVKELCDDSVRQAVSQLEGEDAPAGEFTVVLSSEAGGTMIHEACGHGMEADLVLSGSVYRDKVGQKIASEKVTVKDDGTIKNKRGTLNYDDEGIKTEETVLIENGVLKGYMQSRLTAKKFDTESTGNGRRQTYMHLPLVRMRNTFIAPGKDNPEDIVKSVEDGIFVRKMGGGQVDVISGDFQFKVTEGYIIKNGEIKNSIKGASLVGNGLEVLKTIDMVGNDLGYAVGTCGKGGQGAPVSDAQPTIRIPKIIVGGVVKGGTK